ncbi:MAG: N-6 DNA methylase [Nitrospinae bacterium]|nr:N-6 DNA methylase [Nitrospinota bacterium]
MSREELANQIWRACDIMRRDDNTKLILKYVEHLSWLLFLKVFEAIEDRHATEAEIAGRPYARVVEAEYRWSEWASRDWRGEDLIEFVQGKLLPHLRDLRGSPEREIVATVFGGITTVMKSPYNLKDVIAIVDEIDFHRAEDVHTISLVYESLLAKMGSEAGLSGEFYTPRPIIRFMVQMVDPRIGESVYDPACGSAGFLVETYLHMKKAERTTRDHEILQHRTFFGQESGELPFLLGTMNMVLHGVLRPTIVRQNTLEENIRNIPDSERHHIVRTNPPFGGKESHQIQQNFPVQSQATELLFLQYVLKKLKVNGRCGIVLPDGVLFRGDAFARVKKELLENFNLHTVVSLPGGVFLPYSGVKTNLLFLERHIPDLPPETPVTFVPMTAVDEETGTIIAPDVRPLFEVRRGYTYFAEDDVIWAKITPCMQNGKAAIARDLENGLGFGSTEFHVLRPGGQVIPEWVFYYVRRPSFRKEATHHFTGSVGQQRVPVSFLENYEIPVPPLAEQRRIVERIEEIASRLAEARRLRNLAAVDADVLVSATFEDLLSSPGARLWPEYALGQVLNRTT